MNSTADATREQILDGATAIFAEHGFSRSSLRMITQRARVNLASANYHFGSKEDLYRQVVLRHLHPLNEERASLLAQAEQLAGDQPVPLRAVLDTFVRPLLRRASAGTPGGRSYLRLISRDLAEPPPFMREALTGEFGPLIDRYAAALGHALPGVPRPELFWRMQFTVGALLYVAAHQHDLAELSQGQCRCDDLEACIRRLLDFCAAGVAGSPPNHPAGVAASG